METQIKISITGTSFTEAKQLQILDSRLSPVASQWITARHWEYTLPRDIYIVRLILATGEQYEQIAVARRSVVRVRFDLRNGEKKKRQPRKPPEKFETPEERLLINIFGENRTMRDIRLPMEIGAASLRLWAHASDYWVSKALPPQFLNMDQREETRFILRRSTQTQFLELEYPNSPSTYVSLPPFQVLTCILRSVKNPARQRSEFDVSLKMSNAKAQALLSIMNSGDMARARTLWALEDAEALLYEKKQDPVAAAVGGYYLLKTREIKRLHNWANNLANWFGWLADGCVIHAWQMILENNDLHDLQYQLRIRDRLLESLERGTPIFTEGMRLLYEGLAMCSFQFDGGDEKVEAALKNIKSIVATADMSKETTTYTRGFNDVPIKGHPGGAPKPPTGLWGGPGYLIHGTARSLPQLTQKQY